MPVKPMCKEERDLLFAYNEAVIEHSRAVSVWATRMLAGLTETDRKAIMLEVENTRLRCEKTRENLYRHRKSHGC